MEQLILIDGNSLLFRAFFAMRPMVTSKGIHTQGVFAFINMLNKIIGDYNPDYMAVAFDMKEKTFRHDKYSGYKAGRQQTPIELLSEIPLLHDVLRAMNIAVLELPKYEADDIIGTLSVAATREGRKTLIISGDKDELQLVDTNVNVLINKKGMSEFDIYDIDAMKERYNLTPHQFIDLKALMGDKSDNIPGIMGIGEKKGISLLEKYGNLENIIEHADEIPGKMGENVRSGIDSARLSQWLATINTEVPIEFTWEELKFIEPDYDALIDIYKELEFNAFIKKLKSSGVVSSNGKNYSSTISGTSSDIEYDSSDTIKWNEEFDRTEKIDIDSFIKRVPAESEVFIEISTDASHVSIPSFDYVSLYCQEMKIFGAGAVTPLNACIIASSIADKKYKLSGCGIKRILYTLGSYSDEEFIPSYDVIIAEYLLDPTRSKYSLEKLLLRYCDYAADDNEASYLDENTNESSEKLDSKKCLRRLFYISKVKDKQNRYIEDDELTELFEKIEMPLSETLAKMEIQGIKCDAEILKSIGSNLEEKINSLELSIYEYAGEKFNVNSPKQLSQILFEKLEIPYPKTRGKSGSYSTAVDVLEKLKDDYQIVSDVLEYRKVAKLRSTYVEGLIPLIAHDGRIHPHFMQTVAATGRLSCTEPNLQNIPIRDDYGRQIRKAFVTQGDDGIFTGSDYSQIELRILASLSGDEAMIDDFNQGKDIHRATAARVFDIPEEEVTPLDRTKAKAVNFGVIYGMSGFGLGESLKISRSDGQKYINDYFGKHPAVKQYLDGCISEGENMHCVRTYFGRLRQIHEFESRKFMDREIAKRLAMNTPIQGTAADVIKIAMNSVHEELRRRNLKSKLILQIHDELIVEGPENEVEEVKELLDSCMRGAADFAVELTCDIHSGKTWYELK